MRQPYRLESVTLKDIGVFEHTHVDFPPTGNVAQDADKAEIHIFTGPNGCGKSTLLYALAGIFSLIADDDAVVCRRFCSNRSAVEFTFGDESGKYGPQLGRPFGDSADRFYEQTASVHNPFVTRQSNPVFGIFRKPFDKRHSLNNRSFPFAAFAYAGNCLEQGAFKVDTIRDIEASPFQDALSFTKTVRPELLAQWIANNRTKSALAQAEGLEGEANQYDKALQSISDFIRAVCQLNVRFRLQRMPLAVVINVEGQDVNFDVLPEGLKSIIAWVADLALRLEDIPFAEQRSIFSQPVILFLDEVDIHLHPKWQRRILPAIQMLLPNAQVFVSTHSPFVVGSVEDAWIYRLPDPQRCVCRDPGQAEIIAPEASAAGKSYQLILEEVFDVSEQFDVETEALLKTFYQLRNGFLQNPADDSELMAQAEKVRSRGEELEMVIEMELRQIARRVNTGKEIPHAKNNPW